MYEALKTAGGRIRLWLYQGLPHDCWTRAYDEPELPRWLLEHHLNRRRRQGRPRHAARNPCRPRLPSASSSLYTRPPSGSHRPRSKTSLANMLRNGVTALTIFWQGDQALRQRPLWTKLRACRFVT